MRQVIVCEDSKHLAKFLTVLEDPAALPDLTTIIMWTGNVPAAANVPICPSASFLLSLCSSLTIPLYTLTLSSALCITLVLMMISTEFKPQDLF